MNSAGGVGAAGGNVTAVIDSAVDITQSAANRAGLALYSIGGTGAAGQSVGLITNDALSVTVSGPDTARVGIDLVSAGGLNGFGGDGGPVSAPGGTGTGSLDATVATSGDLSTGFRALSVGADNAVGTGGTGDDVFVGGSLNITTTGNQASGLVGVSSGGSSNDASVGGNAGIVKLNVLEGGVISTVGDSSVGISAQSISGRGGDARNSTGLVTFGAGGGAGGYVSTAGVDLGGTVTTAGNEAPGILAQALGGSGGHGGEAFGLFYSSGGAGGNGGNGGDVSVQTNTTSKITTRGNDSSGIVGQSIAGIGGSGGNVAGGVSIGGGSGSGGFGRSVLVTNQGAIETGAGPSSDADDSAACIQGCSYGVLSQSIGAGGGNGGGSAGLFSVGGQGGSGGIGGTAQITNDARSTAGAGSVTTHLDNSTALLAQSIGGGGGNGGGSVAFSSVVGVAVGGDGGGGGNGGYVEIDNVNSATVLTYGDRSHGLHAQSVGGGGGNGNFAVATTASGGTPSFTMTVAGGAKSGAGSGGIVKCFRRPTLQWYDQWNDHGCDLIRKHNHDQWQPRSRDLRAIHRRRWRYRRACGFGFGECQLSGWH